MYDLAIIGSGPAGISAAKSALIHGLKAVLIEKDQPSFGGTCMNSGCIPAKFLRSYSKNNKDWGQCLERKNQLLESIKVPLLQFFTKQKLDIVWGQAQFSGINSLSAAGKKIEAKNIIIATGSLPKILTKKGTISAQELYSLPVLPEKILIIGAGYIGIETASLLRGLGKEVTIIEKEKRILPFFDTYLSRRLETVLKKQGITIETNVSDDYDYKGFDLAVSSIGRTANISGLTGIKLKDGWVETDNNLKTSLDNVYACGDVNGKSLLAYVAEEQARNAVARIAGKPKLQSYSGLVECVFSYPAMAKVGILEDEAKQKGLEYRAIKSNFLKFSSAYIYRDLDGFIEVVLDTDDKIIGAGIISNLAGELIAILSLAIENKLGVADLKKCLFVHPTLSEIIPLLLKEAP